MSTHNVYFQVECTYENRLDEAPQMSTHNIHFQGKIRKFA